MGKIMELWRVREISCKFRRIGRILSEHFYHHEEVAANSVNKIIAKHNRQNPKYPFETRMQTVGGIEGYCNWHLQIMVAVDKVQGVLEDDPCETIADCRMTDAETAAMQHLVNFWNAYLMLGDSGAEEVKQAVHAIQGVLAIRVARRVNPEIWE